MPTAMGGLTGPQIRTLRERLLAERERIGRVLAGAGEGREGEREPELEEAAQREAERTAGLEVADRERALLAEVERALAKLDAGTYGIGERSGRPIRYERLLAVPWARDDVGA